MAKKPTYEELEQKVKDLDKKAGTSVPPEFRVPENIFQAIGQPALILNTKHEILAVNSFTLKVTGRSEKDLVSRKCYQFFHDFDQPPENCPLKKMLISGQVETAEMEVQVFDRSFLVSCTPVFGESGKISTIIHIATDITERKQAEEALRERDATLRSIFRAAPTGIGLVCDRVIMQANERLCEMIGYSQAELLGQNARMLYPSDEDFEYVGQEKFAQIRKQGTGAVETRWQCKDGKVIDVFLSSAPIDPDDWSAGITFTALDITERRQAEEALKQAHNDLERRVQARTAELEQSNALLVREIEKHKRTEEALLKSEAKYRDLFNNAQVGLLRSRIKDGKIIECNDKFAQIVGFETREECCADFIASEYYMDPGDRERALEIIKAAGKIENYEIRGMRRDGSKGWVRYTGVLNREKGIFEGVIVDITEEKRAREALRENEVLYRSLFTETRAVMILLDPESGDIVDANPAACSYYGYSKEEIARKKILDFNTLPKEQVFYAIEKAVSERQRHFNFQHRLANGNVRDVEVYTNPIKIKGKPLLFSIINDITERKQAEKALRESEEALQKRETELEIQSQHLQEVNSALKVLLQQREKDKKELQENIVSNVKELVLPYLGKLEKSKLDDRQKSYISVAQTNLNDIISPFLGNLSAQYLKLTPMEVQVANLIKHSKTTKEIAELLNLSVETIRFHRKNIRKKFGICNKKANLRTYLMSLQ